VFGTVVAEAGNEETILYADWNLALARQKDFVYSAGNFEPLVRRPSHRSLRTAS